MSAVALRIIHATHLGKNLPHRDKRDEVLKALLSQNGETPEIIDWEPPENPSQLYDRLTAKIAELSDEGKNVYFYEIGVADVGLVAFISLYRWANAAMAPVLFPRYLKGEENVPARFSASNKLFPIQFGDSELVFDGFWDLNSVEAKGTPLRIEF